MPPKYSQRVRSKPDYRLADGTKVPGVTTILKVLDKSNYLIPWANRLGFDGVDAGKYRDEKGMVGTLAHAMILAHLKGESPDSYDNSQREIDQAENAYLKFCEWKKQHDLEPIMVEGGLVSEVFRFGGTMDYYGKIDGVPTLLDFKTGANLYPEMWYQMAGYTILLHEQGHNIEQRILLNIGRDETENFIEAKRSGPSLEDEVLIFRCCLDIYNAKKRLKQE
jgi:hypothetical protein